MRMKEEAIVMVDEVHEQQAMGGDARVPRAASRQHKRTKLGASMILICMRSRVLTEGFRRKLEMVEHAYRRPEFRN